MVVVRFDNREHLDAWLRAPVRKNFMNEVEQYVDHYTLRRIGSGFEGWFDTSENATPPARWRQALVILSALFPIIMIMRRLLAPIFLHLPLPAAYLILLALDVAVLTYFVMPHYSRFMNFWLKPGADSPWWHQLAGWAVILGVLAATLGAALALDPPA